MRVVLFGFFAEDYLISLANGLAKTCSITLFLTRQNISANFPQTTSPNDILYEQKILDSTINLRFVDYQKGQFFKKIEMVQNLIKEIKALQPDIVHYQFGGDPWGSLILPFLRKYPIVETIHDATRHPGDGKSDFSHHLATYISTRSAHQLIVHGQQQAHILADHFRCDLRRITNIPLGPYSLYMNLATTPFASDGSTVLFFGRLRYYKGIEVLLRAAPLIKLEIPTAKFLIVGAGKYPAVEKAISQHPDWFELINRFIPAEEVHTYFERAALVVTPYIEASQSGVIPLAYLFSRPVVASRVGSIPEIVEEGNTGYLVDPNDEFSLAQAIVCLLEDKKMREAMGKAGAAKLEKELSWHAIAEKDS